MPKHRRLIIGYGYLGQAVAKLWLAQGDEVSATTRKVDRFPELRAAGIEPILWDVLRPKPNQLSRADTVVFCVGFDRSLGVPIRDVYVDGLKRTLDALAPPGRLIYVSSTGVYGGEAGAWIDENTPPAPTDDSGRACLEAEQVLNDVAKERDLDTVVLRLAGIYGPGRLIGAEGLRAGQSLRGEPDVHLNLIHVEDAALVVAAAATKGSAGSTFLVADGYPPTRRQFYSFMAQLLGAPEPTFDPSLPARSRGNRKIRPNRMLQDLDVALQFPDYRAGLAHLIAATP